MFTTGKLGDVADATDMTMWEWERVARIYAEIDAVSFECTDSSQISKLVLDFILEKGFNADMFTVFVTPIVPSGTLISALVHDWIVDVRLMKRDAVPAYAGHSPTIAEKAR